MPIRRLTRRSQFLAANAGVRVPMPAFVLLVQPRGDGVVDAGYGITATKRLGGAVIRNRVKRRFRAIVRDVFPSHALAGADHVLIGRAGGIERDYGLLKAELEKALRRLAAKHAEGTAGRASPRS